jgi:hypothetical protein
MQITTIGLDLAKHWFQVHGVDANLSFAAGFSVKLSGYYRLRRRPRTEARDVPGSHFIRRDGGLEASAAVG